MITENNNKYILCEDIFKIYKIAELEVVALRGLDLEVNQGEVVATVSYTHLTLPTICSES